jgi:succinate-semialdehyde dehydrogenase/glutarate-semialdehyde dehydrogenase
MATIKASNAGQLCISPTRFYVQQGIYDRFLAAFASELDQQKVGNGLDEGVTMGPLCHARRLEAITGLVNDARERGASVLAGGANSETSGFFYPPTVIHVDHDNIRLMNEEPFGPVAITSPFKDFDEAIQRANRLSVGLASYVYTDSSARAAHAAHALKSGLISINHFGLALPETPFGGVGDSGWGSEGGAETFDGYLETKFVSQRDEFPTNA